MEYLAVIDYQNLDNPLFLKSFAEAVSKMKSKKGILIHGDSDYTERLIQTGMMREDALIRSIQDLNHRLVSFFADYGLACIGINGFQRGTVKRSPEGELIVNAKYIESLPVGTIVVLTGLIKSSVQPYEILSLPELTRAVQGYLNPAQTHVFSIDSADEIILNKEIPAELALKWSEIEESNISGKIPSEFLKSNIAITLSKPLYNNSLCNFQPIAKLGA